MQTETATPRIPDTQGALPAQGMLANPYVPFQMPDSTQYQPPKGLVRGTLFPGLDLPFMGMVNQQEKDDTPMHELQALGFAIGELGLYLDTHPDDRGALTLFRKYSGLYDQGMAEYQKRYGPLTAGQSMNSDFYTWIQNPWPWDFEQTEAE